MSVDWDVESYRSEHEANEQWELRKNFMLAHRDKFTEEEIVCLAQVFVNIEFLGCRYPSQTMIRVAELAKGLVEKYREKRKHAIKRTFVAASAAASSKVKGLSCKVDEGSPPAKIRKFNSDELNNQHSNEVEVTIDNEGKDNKKNNTQSNIRVPKYGGVKTFNINPNEHFEKTSGKGTNSSDNGNPKSTNKSSDPLGQFVLILSGEHENPIAVIQRNAAMHKFPIRWDFEDKPGGLKACKLYLNDHFIATAVGDSMKASKEYCAVTALTKLRESFYGLKVKSKFFSDVTVNRYQLEESFGDNSPQKLGEDNLGRKLMKVMGWQGGGLGKKEQGIEEPVSVALQVQREGLGLNKDNKNLAEFKVKARKYIRNWIESDSDQDLVFSSEFTLEERKMIHSVASSFFSLKSRSYGKDSNRQLVISRKNEPWEIVEGLKKRGGISDKYELLYPTKM